MVCPRCGSENVEHKNYMGVDCIVCLDCGYDQREQYDVAPDEAQRPLKDRFSPYKMGGHRRTQRRK